MTTTKNPQNTLEPLKSSTDSMAVNSRQELRQRADQRARVLASMDSEKLSLDEARYLIDELSAQQIDLETENAELRRTQVAFEASRARYFDLYEFAPITCITLSEQGVISAANQRATTLLGVPRGALIDRSLSEFVSPEDHETHDRFRQRLFETGAIQAYDLRMVRQDGSRFWARIMMTRVGNETNGAHTCQITISEITERKEAEEGLKLFRAFSIRPTMPSRLSTGNGSLPRRQRKSLLESWLHQARASNSDHSRRRSHCIVADIHPVYGTVARERDLDFHAGKRASP